jgi:hypothetical protein
MLHNITLTLKYFAKEMEWRLYTESGAYWPVPALDKLPETVAQCLRADAKRNLFLLGDQDAP